MSSISCSGLPNPLPVPLALVTGSAHRLGSYFAQALARSGYAILLHYHQAPPLSLQATQNALADQGTPVFTAQADLSTPAGLHTLLARLDETLQDPQISGLGALVNSAAIMPRASVQETTLEDFDHTLALNLNAPFYLSQQAYQRMSGGGLIVNITDIGAEKAWSAYPAYTVSKAALHSLTRVLARAFAPQVRVNAIAPGLTLPSPHLPASDWETLLRRTPLQQAVNPQQVAAALTFLLQNTAITGQTITVDGGYSLL